MFDLIAFKRQTQGNGTQETANVTQETANEIPKTLLVNQHSILGLQFVVVGSLLPTLTS